MAGLPSDTVTFLFTDLEGSTRRWEDDADAMRVAVARHDVLLEDAIISQGGMVFSRMGDGMAAAFGSAPQGIAAAVDAQLALAAESWGAIGPLRARMGLHAGEGTVVGEQHDSQPLNRCARLMAVAHGGQVVSAFPVSREACATASIGTRLAGAIPGSRAWSAASH
jgi:class 3 adenylate cyclase